LILEKFPPRLSVDSAVRLATFEISGGSYVENLAEAPSKVVTPPIKEME